MSTTWRQPNQLTVFPNPAKDIANISFESFQNADYTLVVSDVSGKLLLRKSSRAERGLNKIVLDVSNYSSGLYLITVAYATGEKTTSKLIKQ
jgi:hypothetical protein